MPVDTLFGLIEDVDDELDYFEGLIMYNNAFFDKKSGARYYLYPTLRERIDEKLITSRNDREKIIFESLIHYLNALSKYYEYWNIIEKYKKRNAYHINKYGYEESKEILIDAMKELKKGKEYTDKIDRDSSFFDSNISEVSRQIDWIRSNYEINFERQLRNANFKKKEIEEIMEIESFQDRKKYIEKEISMRKAACVKEKDLCNIYNKSRWLALIFLVVAFSFFDFTFYLLFAIISGLNIRFNSILEEKEFFINSSLFAFGFIFAPLYLLNWFENVERKRNICSKYKISVLNNTLYEIG